MATKLIYVEAIHDWQSTGVVLPARGVAYIKQVRYSDCWITHPDKQPCRIDGCSQPGEVAGPSYLVPGARIGALVARISTGHNPGDETSEGFDVGGEGYDSGVPGVIVSQFQGELELAANDVPTGRFDNSGRIEVQIDY